MAGLLSLRTDAHRLELAVNERGERESFGCPNDVLSTRSLTAVQLTSGWASESFGDPNKSAHPVVNKAGKGYFTPPIWSLAAIGWIKGNCDEAARLARLERILRRRNSVKLIEFSLQGQMEITGFANGIRTIKTVEKLKRNPAR